MLDSTEHLVQEIRHSLMVQVHLYDLTQIGVHEFHHKVNVLKLL